MTWAAPKAVKSPLKKPILVRSGLWVLARRANNGNLIGRENALTKCILTVTLTERAMGCDGHTGKETKKILMKDGRKLLAFLPHAVFVIAEDNDLRLCPKGTKICIRFNGKDTHRGNCPRCTLFAEGPIFAQRNLFISDEFLNAAFFFKEAFQPKLSVRMIVSKRFKERRQAVPMDVYGTEERSHGIKSSRSRGCRRPKEKMGDMPREEDAFHTHINPSQRKIWQRNAPVSFPLVNV
jgi:hypothetical protein